MTEAVSHNVVIMTRQEFDAKLVAEYHRGVARGRFEERDAARKADIEDEISVN